MIIFELASLEVCAKFKINLFEFLNTGGLILIVCTVSGPVLGLLIVTAQLLSNSFAFDPNVNVNGESLAALMFMKHC